MKAVDSFSGVILSGINYNLMMIMMMIMMKTIMVVIIIMTMMIFDNKGP